MHVLKVVKVSLVPSHSLFNHLAPTIIQHPLMTRLLNSLALILKHLMSIDNSVAAAKGPVSLRLINIASPLMISLFDELAPGKTVASVARHRYFREMAVHLLAHLPHHLVGVFEHLSEVPKIRLHQAASFEERIVCKWVSHAYCSKSVS